MKKAGLHRPMPLEAIGCIAIWEGNYTSNDLSIG